MTAFLHLISAERKALLLLAIVLLAVAAVYLLVAPYPQPADYYAFADTRKILGVPHFLNVISNILFLVFGVLGIRTVLRDRQLKILPSTRIAYALLFTGILLTALGSSWFHLAPRNDTLFWDRLPMTIAFMPLFTIIVSEHISERFATLMLWPLLLLGIFSVLWWDHTEAAGAGDLRLYGLVQFLPMLLIPVILILYPSRFDSTRPFWLAIGLYALAKIFEQADAAIYNAGEIVSGHALKHIAASFVPLVLIVGLQRRNYRAVELPSANQTTS